MLANDLDYFAGHDLEIGACRTVEFNQRETEADEGRHTRFEQFLAESDLGEGTRPVFALAVDLGAE